MRRNAGPLTRCQRGDGGGDNQSIVRQRHRLRTHIRISYNRLRRTSRGGGSECGSTVRAGPGQGVPPPHPGNISSVFRSPS